MKLVSVGVDGYGRFGQKTEMRVDGRVVAVVGPNEAGKTSLLRALTHLNESRDFVPGELTRGQEPPDRTIWARFAVEAGDHEVLKGVVGATDVRWFVVATDADGAVHQRIEPTDAIRRDRSPRAAVADKLRRASAHKVLEGLTVDGETEPESWRSAALGLSRDLTEAGETLKESTLDRIRGLAGLLVEAAPQGAPKYITGLSSEMLDLAADESETHPSDSARKTLWSRTPDFLLFGQPERDLASQYNLAAELPGGQTVAQSPPVALANLARLAELDLQVLIAAHESGDDGEIEHLEERANNCLRHVFTESWRQADVTVRLKCDMPVLKVLVSRPAGGYSGIDERSAGLRIFIALLTYTALESSPDRRPILLVDEAENHLHYDAQADLVRVFSNQDVASKVLYSTHSAGCLPQDLGAGVRVVRPNTETGTSSLHNAFWEDGPGLSPLLVGMGASVLAFTPPRFALIAEGASDAILLPALLRDAGQREFLNFQVAPGLAEASKKTLAALDCEAARVAYVVDGDDDGRRYGSRLEREGIPKDRILSISPRAKRVLEDFIDPVLYRRAVNAQLRRSHGAGFEIGPSAIPESLRPAAVKNWCKGQGLPEPGKTAVAYNVLEIVSEERLEGSLVAPRRRKQLQGLLKQVDQLFLV